MKTLYKKPVRSGSEEGLAKHPLSIVILTSDAWITRMEVYGNVFMD